MRALLARGGRLAVLLVSALLVLVAQVGDQIHLAATPHVVCAEHDGQIEDTPHASASGAREGGSTLAAAPDHAPPHVSCALPLMPGNGAVASFDTKEPLEPGADVLVDVRAPEGAPGRTGPPLLHVAPKLSPPRA